MIALSLLGIGCTGVEKNYDAVICKKPLPYEGKPLYDKDVTLPAKDYVIGSAFDETTRLNLNQAMLEAMRLTKANVMSAAVATTKGSWQATRSADGSPQAVRLYWASVGKAFTATVIMQLVEEGKISLLDPVSNWVPEVPNASIITIDHLLQHTSGLFSANEDLVVREAPRYYSPDENIEISTNHGAMFCPGQWWRYSNTGYTLLGKLIEQVDGRPYHEAVNARISDSLMPTSLHALAPLEQPVDVAPLVPADGSDPNMSPDWGYAAGSVVGTAADMIRFWQALLTSKLLTEEDTIGLFERLYPMFDSYTFYGRGVMLYSLPDSDSGNKIWLGHSGGTPGGKAVVAYSLKKKAFVAVALTGDGSAPATAQFLLKQLEVQE